MSRSDELGNIPAADEVRAALALIAESDVFRGSPQLASFLAFVVEATLAGERDRIKGYTIAVEALGRNPKFDPQADPIVRVEATRLRRALDRYYAGPGAASPVLIELTRGSYVPHFSYRNVPRDSQSAALPATAAALPPGNGMPTLLIEPFDILASDGPQTISATALHEKLCDAFARFDTINIVSGASGKPMPRENYRLMGSVEYRDDGTTSVRFRLIDGSDETVVWSRVFERLATTGGRTAAEDAIVTELAAILVQPFGVIRANERLKHLATNEGDPRYRSIVEASESFRSFDPAQHLRARDALEHLTAIDPSFAIGFAYLAALYFRDYQFGFSDRKADAETLDRSLELARRAVELRPESARAYQILFGVLFVRREINAAFAAGDKALALNRYDMTILSDYGGRLIIVGEVERGMEMLLRAAEFGVVRPAWYHFYLFLGSYLRGDLTNTVHHANQMTGENYPLGLIARTLAAAAAGDRERAAQAGATLGKVSPIWRTDLRGELGRFFPMPDLVDRIVGDLDQIAADNRPLRRSTTAK